MKIRIVKRTHTNGNVKYIIQQKHFLFRWWWVDAWINSSSGACCTDDFGSLEEAKNNLCYFDGSKGEEIVVWSNDLKGADETADE